MKTFSDEDNSFEDSSFQDGSYKDGSYQDSSHQDYALSQRSLASDSAGEWVRAFAPATVANVACGFDVLGFAVEQPGDLVEARRRDAPGVVLSSVRGDHGRLPRDADRNTAGIAARFLLEQVLGVNEVPGVELRLTKGLPLASGLGSSAASSVAAVVAVDKLFDLGASREQLLTAAVEGERLACGSAHADNAAPSLFGGFVLVRGSRVTELPVPEGLSCALVHPHVELETGASRALLGDQVDLSKAVIQWGNVGALVASLFRGDLELMASALHDEVAEPLRSVRVPGFAAVKKAALRAGALGCSLSGSGPTIFALCRDLPGAYQAGENMALALGTAGCDVFVSPLGGAGARILDHQISADRWSDHRSTVSCVS